MIHRVEMTRIREEVVQLSDSYVVCAACAVYDAVFPLA